MSTAAATAESKAPTPKVSAPPERNMFFVVKILGKQHKVCEMDTIITDHLIGKKVGEGIIEISCNPPHQPTLKSVMFAGETVILNEVLLVGRKDSKTCELYTRRCVHVNMRVAVRRGNE